MSRMKITKVTTATMAQLYKSRSRAILFQMNSIILRVYLYLQNIDTRALCRSRTINLGQNEFDRNFDTYTSPEELLE